MNTLTFLQELENKLPPPENVHHNITVSGLTIFHNGMWHTFTIEEPLTEDDLNQIVGYFKSTIP